MEHKNGIGLTASKLEGSAVKIKPKLSPKDR